MNSDPTKAELKAEIEELKTKVQKLDPEPSGVSRRSVVSGLLGVGGVAAAIPYFSQPAAAQQALGAIQVGALRDDNGDDQLIVENGGPVRIPNALEATDAFTLPTQTTTISSGDISPVSTHIKADGEAGADDVLETMTPVPDNENVVLLRAAGDDITVKDEIGATGDFSLGEDRTLTHPDDTLLVVAVGGRWLEIAYSNNT